MTFQELLMEYNVHFKTEGKGTRTGWIQFQCPHCGGGSDPNKLYCGYNMDGNYCSCWQCGYHKAAETLSLLTKVSLAVCYQSLSNVSRKTAIERKVSKTLVLPRCITPLQAPHKRFIASRGVNATQARTLWQLGAISVAQHLQWRVFIPVHFHGRIVSWTTRTIGDAEPRYVSAKPTEELIPLRHLLYGEDYCHDVVLVCEGPFDAMRIGPGAVALFGVNWNQTQANRIAEYPKRVVVFDNEKEAQKRALALVNLLAVRPGVTINIVLDAKDPGSASEKEIKLLRKELE